jgi:hypothetical protein
MTLLRPLFVLALVAAAPPPKETEAEKLLRIWGSTVDPGKNCTFRLDGDRLKISVPGNPNLSKPNSGPRSRYARVQSEVTGDFDARVKVVSLTPPISATGEERMTCGGLFMRTDDKNHVSITLYSNPLGNDKVLGFCSEFFSQHVVAGEQDGKSKIVAKEFLGKPVYVRMTREGKEAATYFSTDGKNWTLHTRWAHTLPEKVFFGITTSHRYDDPVEAVFDSFEVTQPGK